jgi:hypothetical protein
MRSKRCSKTRRVLSQLSTVRLTISSFISSNWQLLSVFSTVMRTALPFSSVEMSTFSQILLKRYFLGLAHARDHQFPYLVQNAGVHRLLDAGHRARALN